MTETLEYELLEKDDGVELRKYAAYIVAEVDVRASGLEEAAQTGFRTLADYIFGNNVPNQQIAMRVPVTAPAGGEKIAMTTPVTSSAAGDGNYEVCFSMPSSYAMETLPAPINERVRLVPVPTHLALAIRYRGRNDLNRIMSGSQRLSEFAAANDMDADGEPLWAGYSAPYVPMPMRKWEMLLRVRRA